MSNETASHTADDEEISGVPPLGVDIEHIADSTTWAEQAWRLIRERRDHERKEVEDRERARLDEHQRRRRDEKEWRERQAVLSQQRAAAIDTADLPSSSAHRRARTARRERRENQEEASAVDVQANAMSRWQQRGLLHVWTSEGSREQEDRERREIWDGNMRGKRAQLDKMDAERKRQTTDKQSTANRTTQYSSRPHTAAAAYRPATAATANPSNTARSAWTARPARAMSPPPPATRPPARPCIRCALPATSFVHVALAALVAEHEHLSRLLHSSSPVAVPAAVRHLWPQLSVEQYREQSSDRVWLASAVDVCHECGEWLDDNQHITARRRTHSSNNSSNGSGDQRQQHTATDKDASEDESSEEDESSVRSITQLVNRLLTMPPPSRPPLG